MDAGFFSIVAVLGKEGIPVVFQIAIDSLRD
jgi:hypothetical protein